MATDVTPTIDEDVQTALHAVQAHRPIPPEVEARLDAYGEQFRRRFVQQHGYFDSVPLIRQARETHY